MAGNPDFYPQSRDARLAWHINVYDQLKNHGFAAKYGMPGPDLDAFEVIRDWYVYWVPVWHAEDAYSQQMTGYLNTIAGNKDDVEPPSPPIYVAPGAPPPEPAPGVEKFTRDWARDMKNSTIYAPADGEAMGIATPESEGVSINDLQPVFKAATREAFEIGVTFKKQGMNAVRFEYRHIGGSWLPGGVLLNSPGAFTVAPATPGEPEQIEVRAIFMLGNENVGQWSAIVPVLVAP
jgi:hypothetical protein